MEMKQNSSMFPTKPYFLSEVGVLYTACRQRREAGIPARWRISVAATEIHDHRRDLPVDDLLSVVEVEHVDGGHFGGRAAGSGRTSRVCLVHQVPVRELLRVDLLALARAVVSLVPLGRNDPVPTKVLKVYSERVTAAAGF